MFNCVINASRQSVFLSKQFLYRTLLKILMEKWLRQIKICQNGSKSRPSPWKRKKGNCFSGSQVPTVLWVAQFKWNFPIFSKVSPAWIILAELWNVPWYFYEVSSQGQVCRQMLNVDRTELFHTEVPVSISVTLRAWMGLLFHWKTAGVLRE